MPDKHGLNEETTQRILQRALELDRAAGELLDADQVRSIAAELGISPRAIEQALAEHASRPAAVAAAAVAAPSASPGYFTRFARIAVIGGGLAFLFIVLMRLVP